MLDIVSTDTHIRTYSFFFFCFIYLNSHGLILVLFITMTIWKSLFAFFSLRLTLARCVCVSLCASLCVRVALWSFVYMFCRIIIGRVLKWHFHDGKNGKYCQLYCLRQKWAHLSGHTDTRTLRITRIDLQTHFLWRYQEFGLLTSNVLIIRFYFLSFF